MRRSGPFTVPFRCRDVRPVTNQPHRSEGVFADLAGQLLSAARRHSGYAGHSRPIYLAASHFKKTILPLLALLMVIIIARAFNGGVANLKLPDFFLSLYSAYHQYQQQVDELSAGATTPDTWSITAGAPTNENYVIIVGESMRKDHMSLFGYPVSTTPFLDNANGRFYSNYISTAPNTFESLPRTLALSNGHNIAIGDNIITLAKPPVSKPTGCPIRACSDNSIRRYQKSPCSAIAIIS